MGMTALGQTRISRRALSGLGLTTRAVAVPEEEYGAGRKCQRSCGFDPRPQRAHSQLHTPEPAKAAAGTRPTGTAPDPADFRTVDRAGAGNTGVQLPTASQRTGDGQCGGWLNNADAW